MSQVDSSDQEHMEDLEEDSGEETASPHEGNGGNESQSSDEGGWPDKETALLIELFRLKPQLYDTNHKWYANREKKSGTLTLIASELKCSGKYDIASHWSQS